MAKPYGTTKASSSSSPKGSTSGGGKMGVAIQQASALDNMNKFEAKYNAYSGDVIYNMDYNGTSGYKESTQLRVHATPDNEGYQKVTLPQESNETVVQATKKILDAIPKSTKLKVEVEAGTREEKIAKRYGFVGDAKPTRDEEGFYHRTYRR